VKPTQDMQYSWALLLLGVVACHPAPAVLSAVAAHPNADIASHPSFSFGFSEMPPFGFSDSGRTFEVQRRVQGLIRASLVEKGYVEEATSGALVVRFGVSSAHGDPIDVERIAATDWGRLEVDAYDASSKLEVWRSVVTVLIDPKQIDDRIVGNAVQRALADFPSRANGPGNTALQAADVKVVPTN
jgi:hypothetical protein